MNRIRNNPIVLLIPPGEAVLRLVTLPPPGPRQVYRLLDLIGCADQPNELQVLAQGTDGDSARAPLRMCFTVPDDDADPMPPVNERATGLVEVFFPPTAPGTPGLVLSGAVVVTGMVSLGGEIGSIPDDVIRIVGEFMPVR